MMEHKKKIISGYAERRKVMFRITGKTGSAVCYVKKVELEAFQQICRMCDYEFTKDSKIRIMPDMYVEKGFTVGTTMTVTDKVVPNMIGTDPGCGIYTVNLGKGEIDFEKLDEAAYSLPSGKNVWEEAQETFDFQELCCYGNLKNTEWLERSPGTLGEGEHFIRVDRAADGTNYLMIHSGSGNLGEQVAEIYQQMAVELHKDKEEDSRKKEEMMRICKEQGHGKEVLQALEKFFEAQKKETIPEDLCFLHGEPFDNYLYDVEICQRFAKRNREKIAEILLARAGLTGGESFHTVHNYIDMEEMILRKGAIAAHAGEKVLIPINMCDGSILAIGKGNPEWNYSAPMTYKVPGDIMDSVTDSVEMMEVLKPVYTFKAK